MKGDAFLDLDFGLGDTFLDLDFDLDHESKLGGFAFWDFLFLCLWNIINIPFCHFFFRKAFLDLDFSLDYKGKLRGDVCFFFVFGMSLTFLLHFFFR
ncbi:hypothetical protein C1645_177262 [Glomus cerebriforme]|uniref:Transmembrane protein n=1 Tax=Glomus cerebriforme TaxID=658196 RepID=A0A397TIS9_9GLOM|nr:hypothetical protein C1645_177262 [Glomus cerebriforme]